MLGYLAEVFVGHAFGALAAKIAAITVTLVMTFLLLSAVNTAVVDLIAIQFLMSRDGELPASFQKLNKFGVPNFGVLAATIIPARHDSPLYQALRAARRTVHLTKRVRVTTIRR